ncbi:MAG TPA: zinc transporter ZupT [Bacteroidales bacterium]|nr:zinc transporter ZupT [Bacteroidales bacterium]HOK75306.1 zinc transporter ZupT [Bacteroidales bacterium]HOM40782.1 zinc transporter ZupT [Bacteroidales bacterium]HOU29788.1 zinc transporter ZupT [Bacteroidales bacterium]HPP92461.1 zinc transporter ZupT [Bacteroidales bacterium]
MDSAVIIRALIMTFIAGMATGAGGLVAFFARRTKPSFLSFSLGFSAGVMIYISFTELLPESRLNFSGVYSENVSSWLSFIFLVIGFILTALIDKFIPAVDNPHEARDVEQIAEIEATRPLVNPEVGQKRRHRWGHYSSIRDTRLMRVGIFTAFAIFVHNIPEGIATFISGISDFTIGVSIALAIAIHNIPEGIAVSVPVYMATGSRKKALIWSVMSGFSEPIGALLGICLISVIKGSALLGYIYAIVSGIMIYISFDELLPSAHRYGKHHTAIYGLLSGMIIIGLSLLLLS